MLRLPHLRDAPASTLLRIYVRDHLAAATGGRQLGRRAVRDFRGRAQETVLREILDEIEADRVTLLGVLAHLGIARPRVGEALAAGGELLGRAKLNGQLTGSSPLGRVFDVEALIMGVQGKWQLWRSLRDSELDHLLPDDVDVRELADRARAQVERLVEVHGDVAREALGQAQLTGRR